jgi:hypothetical protein
MDWKQKDWVEHTAFGIGQVNENRGDKLDIDFVGAGRKTILKSTELTAASPPNPDFKFPRDKSKSRTPQFKVERPFRLPPLDFDYLVDCFKRRFPHGFDGPDFHREERDYKAKAGKVLKDKLGKNAFEKLLVDEHYGEVCEISKYVLRSTNLVYPIEKAKLVKGIENIANQQRFANALFDLLHDNSEMEERFARFADHLAEIGANKWPIATYYQFLASDGKWMFMKPLIMKRMADSLKVSLNYKAEPNWLTYLKLQELADRVESELQSRGLIPHSRLDVQGFIWSSLAIESGNYDAVK